MDATVTLYGHIEMLVTLYGSGYIMLMYNVTSNIKQSNQTEVITTWLVTAFDKKVMQLY